MRNSNLSIDVGEGSLTAHTQAVLLANFSRLISMWSTDFLQPLVVLDNNAQRESCSVDKSIPWPNGLNLFWFNVGSKEWTPQTSTSCLTSELKIISAYFAETTKTTVCKHIYSQQSCFRTVNCTVLTASAFTRTSIDERMSRRRHIWLELVNRNRSFHIRGDTLSDIRPRGKIQLPKQLILSTSSKYSSGRKKFRFKPIHACNISHFEG